MEKTYKEPAVHERARDEVEVAEHKEAQRTFYHRFRPLILGALGALILGWWISSILLKDTRHRWIVSTIFAWSFLLVIAFRFIPNSVVTRPVEAVWGPLVSRPFFKLSYKTRITIGVLALVGAVLGSAYGFPLQGVRALRPYLSCLLTLSRRTLPTSTVPSQSSVSCSPRPASTSPRRTGVR
jgi:hypothetical protein